MTKITVIIKDYRCSPNGKEVETFKAGTVVYEQIANWALADGYAKDFTEAAYKKMMAAPENKAMTSPENK